jgi:hypothetical protein
MASSAEIVRLMRHAADRLAEEDAHEIVSPGASVDRRERASSAAVAMAYAEAILRTVAAVLEDTEAQP